MFKDIVDQEDEDTLNLLFQHNTFKNCSCNK